MLSGIGPAAAQTPADTARAVPLAPAPTDTTHASADTSALPVVEMAGVTVAADRLRDADAAHTTALDTQAIAQSGAASTADLLALRSGAFVRQYGASGLSTLSLRGTGSTQTVVLLDGLRVADPQSGQIDLSLLPTLMLESVEVAHGTGSAQYGSGALGGTVHLRTLRPTQAPQVRAATGAGAFGERQASAVASGRTGAWSGLVASRHYTTEGDFKYRNEALYPPKTVRRSGAGMTSSTLYGRAQYQPSASPTGPSWSVAGWWTRAQRGLPGPANAPAGGARQRDRTGRLWVDGRVPLGAGTLDLQAQGQRTALRFVNPPTGTRRSSETRALDLSATWSTPAVFGTLEAGATGGWDQASLRDGVRRLTGAAFAHADASLGPLAVQPALRLDAAWPDGSSASVVPVPRIGLRWPVLERASVQLLLRAQAARAFRRPTFSERFYEPGGNPALTIEDGWSADVGADVQVRRPGWSATGSLTAFGMQIRDQIVWRPSYAISGVQVWSPVNIARVVTRGVEASVRGAVRLRSSATLRGGTVFTHTRATNQSNSRSPTYSAQLPYVPRQQLKAWLGADVRGLTLGLSARLVGPRPYTSDASKRLPPYQVVDAQVGYRYRFSGATVALNASIDNVLDQDYAVVRLYPMPPRHASLRLSLTLPMR